MAIEEAVEEQAQPKKRTATRPRGVRARKVETDAVAEATGENAVIAAEAGAAVVSAAENASPADTVDDQPAGAKVPVMASPVVAAETAPAMVAPGETAHV
ncbi:MAG: hypothetical protein H0U10_08725, partial [Chloroflexia bacterium]|nr:hypothetical protein [Chloroflexia bacterium]